jgi:hypothetical protein
MGVPLLFANFEHVPRLPIACIWRSSRRLINDNKIRFPPRPRRRQGPRPCRDRLGRRGGRRLVAMVTRFTLEVEGSEKPCFVGDSVTRVMAPD